MYIGQQIEQIRQQENIPVHCMCNIFGLTSSKQYEHLINGKIIPSTMHLILFIDTTHKSLDF